MKISAVYRITNTITGDFYIGSSKNVKKRWTAHKAPSRWNEHPNCPMYIDMKKYGVDKFEFQVLAEVETGRLKEAEQQFIETLKPTYNSCNAKGIDIEKQKKLKENIIKNMIINYAYTMVKLSHSKRSDVASREEVFHIHKLKQKNI